MGLSSIKIFSKDKVSIAGLFGQIRQDLLWESTSLTPASQPHNIILRIKFMKSMFSIPSRQSMSQNIPPELPHAFHETILKYSQRLNQEKQLSLLYLAKIHELEAEGGRKDFEIARQNRTIMELQQRLEMYESSGRTPQSQSMQMARRIVGTRFTESFIETVPSELLEENSLNSSKQSLTHDLSIFQDFFIVRPYDVTEKQDIESIPEDQVNYVYKFTDSPHTTQFINTFLLKNKEENLKVYPISEGQRMEKEQYRTLLFMTPSELSFKNMNPTSSIIKIINPSYYHVGICMLVRETICVKGAYYRAPTLYGFVTFYPLVSYFKQLISSIYKDLKYSGLIGPALNQQLCRLREMKLSVNGCIKFKFLKRYYEWVTTQENLQNLLFYSSKLLYKTFSVELLIDILMLLLLDFPVTLYSKDESLLGKLIFFLISIMRPLRYLNPIIVNIPSSLTHILELSHPALIGSTRLELVEPHCRERALFDLDKKVATSWPVVLDSLSQCRKFLIERARELVTNEYNLGQLSHLTQLIINGENNIFLKQYWERFSGSSIYRLHIAGRSHT